jgi:hypothetical protein
MLRLEEISNELSDIGWLEGEIETLQEKFYSRSEKWLEGEKGELAQEVLSELQSACDSIRQVSDEAAVAAGAIGDAFGAMEAA